jgi:hypothetical protein
VRPIPRGRLGCYLPQEVMGPRARTSTFASRIDRFVSIDSVLTTFAAHIGAPPPQDRSATAQSARNYSP